MTYVHPNVWRTILPAYAFGGLLIGLTLPALKSFAAAHLGRGGIAVAFVINIAMPLLVIVLAAIYPRLSFALLGTFLATLAFLFASGMNPPPINAGWLRNLIAQMGPILVVAFIAYHLLAATTVAVLRTFRQVGISPNPMACIQCGYLLFGATRARCPECGREYNNQAEESGG